MSAFAPSSEENNDAKRRKKEDAKSSSSRVLPSSLFFSFQNQEGNNNGIPSVDLSVATTSKQLELLINSLLSNTDSLPYAFYINNVEVISSLQETLQQLAESNEKISYEETVAVTYQPLSVFRVRPVTRCVETMPGHTDAVLIVSYSPDGTRLASGGGDKAVRFWNTITHMPQHTCLGHRDHVLCTAWSPDGALFVSADRSGEIRIWDPKTGLAKGQPLRSHKKWVTSLCFEPLHCDPTCTRLASSSKDHTIKIWNIRTGQCETTISGHTDSVECVKWGGVGLLYTCSRDRTIKVWAVDGSGRSQHKLVRTLTGHAHRINSLALNCDYVLRTGAYQLGESIPLAGGGVGSNAKAHSVLKSTDSSSARSSIGTGTATGTGATTGAGNSNGKAGSSCSSSDTIGVSGHDLSLLQSRALERYRAVCGTKTVDTGEGVDGEILGSLGEGVGELLVSGSDDFTLFVWSPTVDKKPLVRLTGHQQAVNHIAFSPDGRYFASASFDKKVKLWCGKTGRFLATLSGHVGSVYQVAWSADSSFLVSASKDSTVKLWSVKDTKKALFTLPGHEDEVYALDWSPNGTQVASGSKDRTLKIWHH